MLYYIMRAYSCYPKCRLKTAQLELDKVMTQLKEKQERLAATEAKVSHVYTIPLFFILLYCLDC